MNREIRPKAYATPAAAPRAFCVGRWREGLSPFRLPAPLAAVGGRRAAPGAGPRIGAEAAGALGVLLATRHRDPDRAIGVDLAGDVDVGFAIVVDDAVLDAQPVAIGRVAASRFGDDHHAPVAVEARRRPGGG